MLVSPSILAADFANLGRDIEMLNRSSADMIHVDVMDGVFVPNISFGMPVCAAVNKLTQKPLDVHLMIVDPDRYLEEFRNLGAHYITVHYEACTHLHRTIQRIKELGALPGVALNPHTPPEVLSEIIKELALVLVMSVNPGFGGQKFIENTYRKVERLQQMRLEHAADFLIEIDGGVTTGNVRQLGEKGVDMVVAGSFVFNAMDPLQAISDLKKTDHLL